MDSDTTELRADSGLCARLSPFGARLVAFEVPTSRGRVGIVRSLTTSEHYEHYEHYEHDEHDRSYAGAVVGRVSGRIGNARIATADGSLPLPANDGPHHLHGGPDAFDARRWRLTERSGRSACFELWDADGANGYPGAAHACARFALEDAALDVVLTATVTRPCPIAMTYHPYFHLGGLDCLDCRDHILEIAGASVLELGEGLIPTGRVLPADAGGPFDFLAPRAVHEAASRPNAQLAAAHGHDHTFVLDAQRAFDARLTHTGSGIRLTVRSNQPSLQVYTGQWLPPRDAPLRGPFAGLCLEPQGYPDAVNQPGFPSPWLQPGDTYANHIRYELEWT